jgi:hypothetical protein
MVFRDQSYYLHLAMQVKIIVTANDFGSSKTNPARAKAQNTEADKIIYFLILNQINL